MAIACRSASGRAGFDTFSRAAPLATSHTLVRRRPSDERDHEPMGSARHRCCLSHVRALATGELLQYMREEFLLDALVDYQIEPEDPTRTIPIPSAGPWTRRSVRPALMSPGSNGNWVPPPPVM